MSRKVFISYKYKDEKVAKLKDAFYENVNGVLRWNYRNTRVCSISLKKNFVNAMGQEYIRRVSHR